MQIGSLRFRAAFAVLVIVGASLTTNTISALVVKTSRNITNYIHTKTPNKTTKTITAKIPRSTTKYSIKGMQAGSIDTVWFDDVLPAGAVANADNTQTQLVAGFKNAEGFYVTAVNGGGWEVSLNPSGTRGSNENFRLIDIMLRLENISGKYKVGYL